MLLVPVQGDSIITKAGHPFKVVSFSNLNPDGPLLRVTSTGSSAIEEVLFREVDKIEGQAVKLIKNADGFNVFHSDAAIKRPADLPQPQDRLTVSTDTGQLDVKVVRLNLHVRNKLSLGLHIDAVDDNDVEHVVRLKDVVDIDGQLFSKSKFKKAYGEYFGASNEEAA